MRNLLRRFRSSKRTKYKLAQVSLLAGRKTHEYWLSFSADKPILTHIPFLNSDEINKNFKRPTSAYSSFNGADILKIIEASEPSLGNERKTKTQLKRIWLKQMCNGK